MSSAASGHGRSKTTPESIKLSGGGSGGGGGGGGGAAIVANMAKVRTSLHTPTSPSHQDSSCVPRVVMFSSVEAALNAEHDVT